LDLLPATALKCYLYRPILKPTPPIGRPGNVRLMLRSRAYRNLWLMTPILAIVLAVLIGITVAAVVSWAQGRLSTGPNAFGVAGGVR